MRVVAVRRSVSMFSHFRNCIKKHDMSIKASNYLCHFNHSES